MSQNKPIEDGDDFSHYFNATQRLSAQYQQLRDRVDRLWCCECGVMFSKAGDEDCDTHTEIRALLDPQPETRTKETEECFTGEP